MIKKLIPMFILILLSSCASLVGTGYEEPESALEGDALYAKRFHNKMNQLSQTLASNIKSQSKKAPMVVVTTFVPVGDYENPGVFGQLCAEQVLLGLSKYKFRVYDIRKTKEILLKESSGFFSVSNKVANVRANVRTDLVLVGSYAKVSGDLMVNAMLVRADNGEVVSSASEFLKIAGDEFLEPLVASLKGNVRQGKLAPGAKGTIEMREPVMSGDSTDRILSIKISKLARDVIRNLKSGTTERSIIVTTYVDLDHLNRTNSFGRYVTEKLMGELSNRGFGVIEVRVAKELLVSPNIGAIAMTRNMEDMLNKYKADAMIVGTYQKIDDVVKVHTRMIIADNQEIISVASTEIKSGKDDKFMQALFKNQLDLVSSKETIEGYSR